MPEKKCPRCGETKPWTSFYLRKNGRPVAYCKPCHHQVSYKWMKANGYSKRMGRKYYAANPEKVKKRMRDAYAKKQGLDNEEARLGPCDICGNIVRRHWDHDHRTGSHRGWLCGPCNMAIGLLRDDPSLLLAAAAYLVQWEYGSHQTTIPPQ